MQHGRKDYQGRIIDQLPQDQGGIPEDEPVFLLRAQDIAAAATVQFWAYEAACNGASPDVVAKAREIAAAMAAWPVKKTPDSPA